MLAGEVLHLLLDRLQRVVVLNAEDVGVAAQQSMKVRVNEAGEEQPATRVHNVG